MWPFKRKPESAAEKQALANLDATTFEVANDEMEKEKEREQAGKGFGPHALGRTDVPFHDVPGDPVPEPVDDPDPAR
jgi:hypothetical protein